MTSNVSVVTFGSVPALLFVVKINTLSEACPDIGRPANAVTPHLLLVPMVNQFVFSTETFTSPRRITGDGLAEDENAWPFVGATAIS